LMIVLGKQPIHGSRHKNCLHQIELASVGFDCT
jgi:hypothetical protein